MKTLTKILFTALFLAILFYVAGSVSNASFNIGNWTGTSREVYAAMWLLTVICSSMGIALHNTLPQE